MADISDVEQAIVNLITSTLYPGGNSQISIIGPLCRVYRGWPNSAALNSDLAAGTLNISVSAESHGGRVTTRYLPDWHTIPSESSLIATMNDGVIAVTGTPALGDVIGALIDGNAYAYRVQAGDTPQLVAANLAQLIQVQYPTSLMSANIMVAGAASVSVRVVCDQASLYESRCQEKDLRAIFWCPNPAIRDVSVSTIDSALNALGFLSMTDGTTARMVYKNTESFDQAQNALLYRRDLIYTVEYSTTTSAKLPSMLFGASELNGNTIYN